MKIETKILFFPSKSGAVDGSDLYKIKPDPAAQKIASMLAPALQSPLGNLPDDMPLHESFEKYKAALENAFAVTFAGYTPGDSILGYTFEEEPIPSQDVGRPTWLQLVGLVVKMSPVAIKQLEFASVQYPHGVEVEHYLSVYPSNIMGTLTRSCTWCFDVPPNTRTVGIGLFIEGGRTRVVGAQLVTDQAPQAAPLSVAPEPHSNETLWFVEWESAHVDGKINLCIRLDFVGDPPAIRGHTWLVAEPEPPIPGGPGPFEKVPEKYPDALRSGLVAYTRSFRDALDRRRELVAKRFSSMKPLTPEQAEQERAHRFFIALEEKTNPAALGQGERSDLIQALGLYLMTKVRGRVQSADYKLFSVPTSPEEHHSDEDRSRIERVVQLVARTMLELLLEHFPSSSKGIDMKAVSRAFEWFAEGSLHVVDFHGIPNGFNYFSFAEFAALMRANEPSSSEWRQLFEIFGRTAEIFVGSFHECGKGSTVCALKPEWEEKPFTAPSRAPSQQKKDELRLKWSTGSLDDHFNRLVLMALRGDGYRPSEGPGPRIEEWGCGAGEVDEGPEDRGGEDCKGGR